MRRRLCPSLSEYATAECDSRGGGGSPATTGMSHARELELGFSSSVYRSLRYLQCTYRHTYIIFYHIATHIIVIINVQLFCTHHQIRRRVTFRCFSTSGPTLWNSLPEQLRQLDTTAGQFKRSLKTFMFG